MTQTGKCDTCRQRKVKCDEERPKCGACRKKDRPCTYSYGKASAFVVQDPNQLTKHGKSKIAPVVYALTSSAEQTSSTGSTPSDLRLTTEREAENGLGLFQTLAPISRPKVRPSKKIATHQKKRLKQYLQLLQEESALASIRPCSPENTIIARYIHMLGAETPERQPLSILGTWIHSVPSRIGSNRMLDLAVEFLVNSFDVFWDDMDSKRKVARASKAKALKELQLVVLDAQKGPSYEVLLATKMHYAAEALMGIDSMYHAIHAFGLSELLKSGTVSNVDDEHYWNLIDNTYIDDVNEAMLAGRKSVYDSDFYLSSTYPPPFDSDIISLSPSQRASMAIMHIFIQCPRLVCLIRHAIMHPEDATALASAVSHAESLWLIDLPRQVAGLLEHTTTVKAVPPMTELADIMQDSLEYDSVQSMILCTRYWMLQNILCGMIDALYRHFPTETSLSLLPSPEITRKLDVDAALHLARSVPWAQSISQRLPLVPLRLHTPLQISIGPWHRIIRAMNSLKASNPNLDPEVQLQVAYETSRAERMKSYMIEECNRIHVQWDVSAVDEKPLIEALDSMAGEKIPDWLPVRVRFEAEDGEMVMKLDYENRTGTFQERYDIGEKPPKRSPNPITPEGRWQTENVNVYELPFRSTESASPDSSTSVPFDNAKKNACLAPSWSNTVRPADFIHSTGRNLCSTSGWWPNSSTTSTILLDSTHKASAFSKIPPKYNIGPAVVYENQDSHPCLASSWWPQSPNSSTPSSSANTPRNACLSPAWAGQRDVVAEDEFMNRDFSPASSSGS